MEAKDTVMNEAQLVALADWGRDGVLKAQAEISFKAGIKEVVELMRKRNVCSPAITGNDVKYVPFELTEGWQAKLKEWGI